MIAYAALAVAILAWGIEYPLMKSATVELGPLRTGAVMFTVATLLLGLRLMLRGAFRRERLPDRRTCGAMLLIGLIGFFLNAAGLLAIRLTSVTNVATLARTDVLFSMLLAVVVFHERIDRVALWMTPVMLAGACLLTGVFTTPLSVGSIGDGLILVSAFLVALNAYIIRHVAQRVAPDLIGFTNFFMIGIGFSVVLLILAPSGQFKGLLLNAFSDPTAFALGVLSTFFVVNYYIALRMLPVWKVRLLMLLIPVAAAIAGRIWLGEVVTTVQVLGMVLVCAGAAGAILAKRTTQAVCCPKVI